MKMTFNMFYVMTFVMAMCTGMASLKADSPCANKDENESCTRADGTNGVCKEVQIRSVGALALRYCAPTGCHAKTSGDKCWRFDGSQGTCTEQPCATMKDPKRMCLNCVK